MTISAFHSKKLKGVSNIWFSSISACVDGEKTAESPAKSTQFLSGNSLKSAAQMLKIDLQLTKLHLALIPCEYFDLQQDLGALENLTKSNYMQKLVKKLERRQIYTHNVNWNLVLSDSLTCEYV